MLTNLARGQGVTENKRREGPDAGMHSVTQGTSQAPPGPSGFPCTKQNGSGPGVDKRTTRPTKCVTDSMAETKEQGACWTFSSLHHSPSLAGTLHAGLGRLGHIALPPHHDTAQTYVIPDSRSLYGSDASYSKHEVPLARSGSFNGK